MSDKVEDLQQNLSAFKLQDDSKVSEPFSPPTHRNVGPSRPKLFLPMMSSNTGRQLPPSLPLHLPNERFKSVANEEQDRKLKEIMSQNGLLQIDGKQYVTKIDEMELVGDLGNGTCGHVVQMRHKETGSEIAVKQMRRTGNSDENKRILMDLDVVLKSHDCENIVLCLGCFITDSDVWICMELMATCFDKLLKQLKQPIPEPICGKVAVSTLKALNYLKENHGVIHRDVKPSNILLDTLGRVKLCDFGISGRLVDSKAKTRSAGCAAYMAPERIEPPNPNKPDYDIRADVWSLGITLVELATGSFPYHDCKTDFEVLTKVLAETPPILPVNDKFSMEFRSFVANCLIKDYKDRPKYKKLLSHEFILKYDKEDVDVGAWYRSHMKNFSNSFATTPSHGQFTLDNLSHHNFSIDRSFKPQPSPRVPRARRQTSQPTTTTTYPAALAERDRRPSYEIPESRRKLSSFNDPLTKPPSSLTSPVETHRNFFPQQKQLFYKTTEAQDQTPTRSQGKYYDTSGSSSACFSSGRSYDFHTPSNGAANHITPTSPHQATNLPRSSGYTSVAPLGKTDSSKAFNLYHYPRQSAKFEFTNPSTTYSLHQANLSSIHRQGGGLHSVTSTGRTQDPYQYYNLPNHTNFQQQHTSLPQSLPPTSSSRSAPFSPPSGAASLTTGLNLPSKKERLSRSEAGATAGETETLSSPSSSSSSSTNRASYFLPTSWRSTFNSITNSLPLPSPMLLRRMRTASTDRGSSFDTARRFQPNYRSWNEKDNFYQSSKR